MLLKMRSRGSHVAGLIVAIAAPAAAENPVTRFTDADGVPKREYLSIVTCYGGLECNRTCHIVNKQDQSRLTCGEWFDRYCPPSLQSAACEAFEAEVGTAIERD